MYSAFIRNVSLVIIALLVWTSCGDDTPDNNSPVDKFDRSAMLSHWLENFIKPGLANYKDKLDALQSATSAFVADPSDSSLQNLRGQYTAAYQQWQSVSMFEIGKAEEIRFRNRTNVFPTDKESISENIASGTYNLNLPSTINQQGFPAIDYMIYGTADGTQQVVAYFQDSEMGAQRKAYLKVLVDQLVSLTTEVSDAWNGSFGTSFVENDGSDATSSVNSIVNDFIFYYEKYLRAGKVGIPAGVFNGNSLPQHTEALYSNPNLSKGLLQNALDAFTAMFKGDAPNGQSGPSLFAYLDYIQDLTNSNEGLNDAIITKLTDAKNNINGLDDNLSVQVTQDNIRMLQGYDALQAVVVLLKTDMMSALNIKVDYVDADGD